ncbi:SPOR domain-containing protein [Mariprofundus sp. NF]|nr:SPOR domain-containing protein [Mariprofundus sp. NF]
MIAKQWMFNTYKVLALTLFLAAATPVDSAVTNQQRERAYQILKQGEHHAVTALAKGDREILLGLLALDHGNAKEAIAILSSSSVQGDPVAAMIRAEAYRRQSVQAATRAGSYARAVNADIGRLKKAKLSAGLDEAELRLEKLVTAMDRSPVAVAAVVTPQPVNQQPAVATVWVSDNTIQPASEASILSESINQMIETWRSDWQSRDADAYLSHYHPAFSNAKHDYASWAQYKRRVNRNKTFIEVDVSNIKIVKEIADSSQARTVIVTFNQKYRSNNFSANDSKQLYLTRNKQSESWRILSEGSVGSSPRKAAVRALKVNTTASKPAQENNPTQWAINVAAFDTRSHADEMASSILIDGEQQPFVSDVPLASRQVYRVRIGMFASKSEAVDAMMQICPQLDVSDCWLENLPGNRN